MTILRAPLKSDAAVKRTRWCVCVFLLFLALGTSEAADAGSGGNWIDVTVTSIAVCTSKTCPPKGSVIIGLSAMATGTPPPCSGGYRDHIIIDVSTAAGAFAAQLFQHSAETGSKLMVTGTGTCDLDSRFETLGVVSELIATAPN
jgi:hypothetical protein